jgi:Bacterial Ig-like domain (group 3)
VNSANFIRRLMAGAVVLAISGGAAVVTSVAASAQLPGDGTLSIDPPTGDVTTRMTGRTSGPCPDDGGNTTGYNITVAGPPNNAAFQGTLSGTTSFNFSNTVPFDAPGAQSVSEFAAVIGVPVAAGTYDLTLHCVSDFGDVTRNFAGSVTFTDDVNYVTTPNGTPTPTPVAGTPTPSPQVTPTPTPVAGTPTPSPQVTPTPTPPAGAKATKTALFQPIVQVPHFACGVLGIVAGQKVPPGNCSILIAIVAPPDATGTVQFKDRFNGRSSALGDPVPVRVGGLAVLLTAKLARGTHSLTAMFIPGDSNAFTPSTSKTVRVQVGRDDH